jgi:methyltransferase (TIGR00027 family)
MTDEPLIRDVSDTARWMAVFRARESERADAAFHDPFARALAGERGQRIADAMTAAAEHEWSFIARTYLFDRFVVRLAQAGVDVIVNLAAGLDTRPYRMELPSSLRWIEVDLPEILDYKTSILEHAAPRCTLERVPLDLSNGDARRGLFTRIGRDAKNVAVLSEGLLIYLMAQDVAELAMDLARPFSFHHWVIDLTSPGLLEMMKERLGPALQQAGAPFLFAPADGPEFFARFGWRPSEVRSILKSAAKLGRLPLALRVMALLPESSGAQGSRPWSGVCLLQR